MVEGLIQIINACILSWKDKPVRNQDEAECASIAANR
jgi:hypothetical protein